jgi:hypothetical protein
MCLFEFPSHSARIPAFSRSLIFPAVSAHDARNTSAAGVSAIFAPRTARFSCEFLLITQRGLSASRRHEEKGAGPCQRVPASGRTTAINKRYVDETEEAAIAHGPASLSHLNGGGGDRGRRHSESAAGDGDGAAAIDAAGIDKLLKRCVERRRRLNVRFRPRLGIAALILCVFQGWAGNSGSAKSLGAAFVACALFVFFSQLRLVLPRAPRASPARCRRRVCCDRL